MSSLNTKESSHAPLTKADVKIAMSRYVAEKYPDKIVESISLPRRENIGYVLFKEDE